MAKIKWENYPKLQPYISRLKDASYLNYEEYFLSEETLIEVIEIWIDYYDKNIEMIVENTMKLFNVTHGECGYEAIIHKWDDYKGQKPNRITENQIRECYLGNFTAAIAHLLQKNKAIKTDIYKTYNGGATGLMMTCKWSLRFHESNLKYVKYNVVTDFWIGVDLGASLHTETDMYE